MPNCETFSIAFPFIKMYSNSINERLKVFSSKFIGLCEIFKISLQVVNIQDLVYGQNALYASEEKVKKHNG